MSDYIEQEIDFRRYIKALLSKWYWIVGLALLAGIAAYAVSVLVLSPSYVATALVSIIEPRQRVQFDPRIVTVEENQPLRAYPEIAVSDELLSALQSENPVAAAFSLQSLRSMLSASPGRDPSLLNLSATYTDPETAAAIANGWADLFVSWANITYGDSSEELLAFFKQRLQDAAAELKTAEDALIAYQAENRTAILMNELESLQQAHADLLAKDKEIALLSRDIESLLAPPQTDVATDRIAALLLKFRTLDGPSLNEGGAPAYWLQLSADDATTEDAASPEQQIRNLQTILAIQAEQTATALMEIEPRILATQEKLETAKTNEALLQRNVELAIETQTALARAVEEKRITSQDAYSGVRLVSRSATPTVPVGPRKSLNTLAAAAGAGFLSTLIVLLGVWWRSDEDLTAKSTGAGSRTESDKIQPSDSAT